MLGLPGSTKQMDFESLTELFNPNNQSFHPDMLKIYPCMVTKGTKLYEQWQDKKFVPLTTEEASEMIDMGGQEKDYRETGGFVEIGGKERADDVPARLSKNEFVFTADAVRAAGGGDIDKGSEVMQNLMDNLEAGGEVSEESQGLEGAQAMYDQQQMLQSRMI